MATNEFCGRCGRWVSARRYSRGQPYVPSEYVQTGSEVRLVPVYQHGGPTMCHPIPTGAVNQTVPVGYRTDAISARPWAPGRSVADEGCDDCRDLAASLPEARARLSEIEAARVPWLPNEPAGLLTAARPERDESFGTTVAIFVCGVIGTIAAPIVGFLTTSPGAQVRMALLFAALPAAIALVSGLFITAMQRRLSGEQVAYARARAANEQATAAYRRERAVKLASTERQFSEARDLVAQIERTLGQHDRSQALYASGELTRPDPGDAIRAQKARLEALAVGEPKVALPSTPRTDWHILRGVDIADPLLIDVQRIFERLTEAQAKGR